jgi:hypothetical protein
MKVGELASGRLTVPVPNLSSAQMAWVTREAACYIENQRQIFRGRAIPLSKAQVVVLRHNLAEYHARLGSNVMLQHTPAITVDTSTTFSANSFRPSP